MELPGKANSFIFLLIVPLEIFSQYFQEVDVYDSY